MTNAFEIDYGARCSSHQGEVFPPRCYDCQAAELEAAPASPARVAKRYIPGSECPLHRGYPMPCDRCERDQAEGAAA